METWFPGIAFDLGREKMGEEKRKPRDAWERGSEGDEARIF